MAKKTVPDKHDKAPVAPPPEEPRATAGTEDQHPGPNGADPNGETEAITSDELDMGEFAVEAEAAPADELDSLEEFALEQNFNPNEIEHDPPVPARRPQPDVYFRVRPGDEHTLTVGIYEPTGDDGDRGDVYLVKRDMLHVFEGLVTQRQIYVCVTVQGKIMLWPAKLPRPGRRSGGDRYNETALKGAELAKTTWTRIYSDQDLKCYRIKHPADPFPDPDWSKVPPLKDLMRRAFGDGRIISGPDHPEARRIIGRRNK
jgi:hypothetical protein